MNVDNTLPVELLSKPVMGKTYSHTFNMMVTSHRESEAA